MEISKTKFEKLKDFYSQTGKERVGFYHLDEIVEVENIDPKPEEAFTIKTDDIFLHTEKESIVGTWHTHPGSDSNLSNDDLFMFKAWPSLVHFIIGNDGIKCYGVKNNKVVNIDYVVE